jgi:hypothetical protein
MVLFCVSVALAAPIYLLFGLAWWFKRCGRMLREYLDSIDSEDL